MAKKTEIEKLKKAIKRLSSVLKPTDRQKETLEKLESRLKAISPKPSFTERVTEKLTGSGQKD